MAGTRLLIQSAVAVEFFFLVSFAVYFGLCQQGDVLCASLYGSNKNQLAEIGTTIQSSKLHQDNAVSVIVPANDVTQWKAAFEQVTDHRIIVDTNEVHSEVCRNKNVKDTQHHIWICPETQAIPQQTTEVARVEIISGGTSLVYPWKDIDSVVDALFPPSSSRAPLQRWSLQFTLVTQDGTSWHTWGQALTNLVDAVPFPSLPCLKGSSLAQIEVNGDLSKVARPIKRDNETLYQISTRDAQQYLSLRERDDSSVLNIAVYVPSEQKMPLFVQGKGRSDSPRTAFTVSNEMVSIVSRIPSEEEPLEAFTQVLRLALEHSVPFLHSKCLGFPSLERLRITPSGTLPSWLVQVTRQRLLRDVHEKAYNEILLVHGFLVNFSAAVDPSGQLTQSLLDAANMLNEAVEYSRSGNWQLAMETLEASLEQTQAILADPTFAEPPDFPMDHYFAVFSPLLFPLVLPVVAGLVREVKRYKKLQEQKSS